MTPEDVEAAKPYLTERADLVINACASFSDATPALELYGDLDQPVLLWSFREPGPVGDRLWLNSMCGANLFGHALVVHAGRTPAFVHGDPNEPQHPRGPRRGRSPDLPEASRNRPRRPGPAPTPSPVASRSGVPQRPSARPRRRCPDRVHPEPVRPRPASPRLFGIDVQQITDRRDVRPGPPGRRRRAQ